MSLFAGIHEIRLFRPMGVAVGYFDDWDAALRAVENEPSLYKAAYFTINPVKLPDGIPLNPSSFYPASSSASDSDIERRIWLLVDFDPPRDASTNSTDAEKAAAREQAQRAREYLRNRGWPEPALCDSGNGWHLLYALALPNDASALELIKAVLSRLHQLFPMVDMGNFNASRLCKLYGSWARKGQHVEDRPWRRSAIVEAGGNTAVSEAQLRELSPVLTARLQPSGNVKLERLLGFLDYYSVVVCSDPRDVPGGWQIEIECPWEDEHSDQARRDTVVSFIAGLGFGFNCKHSHCVNRHWPELRTEMERRNPGLTPYFGKLPQMTHSDIARQFVEEHDDFVRIYDRENATGVWMPGVRWQIGDAGDSLLRMAIRRYLDELYERYPTPEASKPDSRRALKQAAFVSGALSEIKPWLPPKSIRDFDADAGLLPVPDGKVAALRLAILREQRREDCQTGRIKKVPTPTPTTRWDRFLDEITCGNLELKNYIVRLSALSITGLSLHILVFFYGIGRNGKGVLLRLLEKILGGELYAACLRPEDVEYRRGAEDRNKRLMGRLRGKRLVYTGETVSGRLDWTLLKTLSGGDTLAGGLLYKDTEGFTPSHTLFLLTNDRPKLPPTVAFKERLRYVSFDGDFRNSKDFTLEADLEQEIPGILWKLIQAAPSVFTNGDEPPASVIEAGLDILDENDLARPFIEEWLVDDPAAITPLQVMTDAVQAYAITKMLGDGAVDRIMDGIRSKWKLGRGRVEGKEGQVRGLLGVSIRRPS